MSDGPCSWPFEHCLQCACMAPSLPTHVATHTPLGTTLLPRPQRHRRGRLGRGLVLLLAVQGVRPPPGRHVRQVSHVGESCGTAHTCEVMAVTARASDRCRTRRFHAVCMSKKTRPPCPHAASQLGSQLSCLAGYLHPNMPSRHSATSGHLPTLPWSLRAVTGTAVPTTTS